MPRQPFGLPHLCIDSHLCRCIVQQLCVAVFMHPCITALCGCLYASLHNGFVRPPSCILCTFMNALLVSHHCLVSRLGCHICASTAICAVASVQWQPFVPLHRATALCGCLYASLLKTLGVHFIRHPCLTRKLRVLAPAAPKSRAMPVCGSGSGAGLSNRACSVGFASLPRQPFGLPHLCIDSHLCRCICASTAICAVASCNGFVWLSLCILA